MPVPLFDLTRQYQSIQEELETAALNVLRSGRYVLGPEVEALESELGDYTGASEVIGMSSGTDALLAALMALGIGHGDAVALPVYSFFATAGVVTRLGARPVFVDIEPQWCNMSADGLRQALETDSDIKAVIFVHLYGAGEGIHEIRKLCDERSLPLIEDAAQAIGTRVDGQSAGTLGTCACFSTFPTKNLGSLGDGGFVTTTDPELGEKLRRTRVHGQTEAYKHAFVGGNFRIDALQAALLRVKLRHLESWIDSRRSLAARYREGLGAIAGLRLPAEVEDRHAYHQFVIHVAADRRDGAIAALREREIGCNVYYPLAFHQQPCFVELGYGGGSFPVAEAACATNIALPIFPELRHDEQDQVIQGLIDALG